MTVLEAMKFHVKNYPLDSGLLEFVCIKRGLDASAICTMEIANSKEFKGARADVICELIDSANISEGSVSISVTDKALLVKMANKLYKEIGEPTIREYASDDQPTPTVSAIYEWQGFTYDGRNIFQDMVI